MRIEIHILELIYLKRLKLMLSDLICFEIN